MDTNTRVAEVIAQSSPEGRPAFPGLGLRGVGVLFSAVALTLVLGSFIVAAVFSPRTAVAVGGLAFLLAAVNPVTWLSIARARERDIVRREISSR